jgi:hypothetical protein
MAKPAAAAVSRLSGDGARLVGFWGDADAPKAARKPEPTLGQRATEIARALR